MKRAKGMGVPFAWVLKFATKAFADGEFSIGLTEEIWPQKMRLIERESRRMDRRVGRRFASVKEAQAYLLNS